MGAALDCFDEQILDGFERARAAGNVMKTDIENIQFKILDGPLGIVLDWDAEHFKTKRHDSVGTAPEDIPVLMEPDPDTLAKKFNFTKANSAEFLVRAGR